MADSYGPIEDITARYQDFQDILKDKSVGELLDMLTEAVKNDPWEMRFAEIELIRERIMLLAVS